MTLQSKLKPVLYHEEHGSDGITSRPVILPSSLRVVVYILLVTFHGYFSAESLGWDSVEWQEVKRDSVEWQEVKRDSVEWQEVM